MTNLGHKHGPDRRMTLLEAIATVLDNAREYHGFDEQAGTIVAELLDKAPNGIVLEGEVKINPYGPWSDVDKGLYVAGECFAYEAQNTMLDRFENQQVTLIVIPNFVPENEHGS